MKKQWLSANPILKEQGLCAGEMQISSKVRLLKRFTVLCLWMIHCGFAAGMKISLGRRALSSSIFKIMIMMFYQRMSSDYPGADKPIIMFAAGDRIYFAKRDGNEIHTFHTKTKEFNSVFNTNVLTISAMCRGAKAVYILDKNYTGRIQILDYSFHASGRISTGIENIDDCKCIHVPNRHYRLVHVFQKTDPSYLYFLPFGFSETF